ncbi:TetR/AcrR family transcriptional regulator [Mycolicibacterium hodleri]|uniref:TetR/AcrR family transcriptional regulator n=1 Tax=Mycolicibacterium hodleri TaxID=49897 RepID=A0A502EHX9_9MYCO|nr:TetR family transcriptional regulator [Mycolicibacterium hodleri]TPG36689.1 TetR/AcrR family transcriptional regulator [Mycolicibacterium hodleri]
MPRTPDPVKREDLLAAVVEYLESHGVNDLSLAPMAEALGTSKRMLLYYFGDRRGLLEQALDASRPKAGNIFRDVTTADGLERASMTLWRALTRGEQQRSVRMLLQVLSLATTEPDTYGDFAKTAIALMLDPITAAFRSTGFTAKDSAARATLIVSGLRGLCQDLLISGDRARVDTAARLMINAAVRTVDR